MNKSDLIKYICNHQKQIPEKTVSICVNTLINKMINHFTKGEKRIEIRDFAAFSLRYRAPRKARNPKTGKELITKQKFAIHFKPGKDLKKRINDSIHLPIKEN